MGSYFTKNGDKKVQNLVFAHSSFLSTCLSDLPEAAFANPSAYITSTTAQCAAQLEAAAGDVQTVMHLLRVHKRACAALIGYADIARIFDDVTVMAQLSSLADFCMRHALRALLRDAHDRKILKVKNKKAPEKDCGVCVIAVGKWGAHELNYSSDIDLMVIFDHKKSTVVQKDETQNVFIRLTRDLARLLDQPTEDGYVFRTDLRLRPDPGAMPLAISLDTAEFYYGSLGQNWERAAMIKARPVAGDMALGADFMAIMERWIWRKNLDFAAIQDIHSIKRQINAKQKKFTKSDNIFQGFNVKLGHGGIREIEFFAQTQQLIFGGRDASLRASQTLMALDALCVSGHISSPACQHMKEAYIFLRHVEHRLQMQNDLQTHSLPEGKNGFADIAAFCEYKNEKDFIADLQKHTGHVRAAYASLFTEAAPLSGPGSLVFTGVEDDPETLQTLKKMGFETPEKVTSAVRGWHHGRYRAARSERARQILTELIPHLLEKLGQTAHPDDALTRFDAFLARLPSGVPIFSMFAKNPQLMDLACDIMGTAPALAEYLGTHPQVLDGVLSRDYFGALPTLEQLSAEFNTRLKNTRSYEDILDSARRFAREKRFHAGIHILRNLSPDAQVRGYLADIAQCVLGGICKAVEDEFSKTHGRFKTGEWVILGMGSFAARRMYFDSDLDIIGLYQVDAKETQSTGGKKSVPASTYYIMLMQRLLTALGAATSEGRLYEADTRLRPSGTDGPLACTIESFLEYQKKSAWTWEHMSLCRARPVYAAAKTAKKIEAAIHDVIAMKRDGEKLKADVVDMREKLVRQFGSADPWNLKHARGGIVDIMFVVQYLVLKSGCVPHPTIATTLDILKDKKLLTATRHKTLSTALAVFESVQGYLRLASELPFNPQTAPHGVKQSLVAHVYPDKKMTFTQFAKEIEKLRKDSFAIYEEFFITP